MIDLLHDIFNIAGRYGLKVISIDATDVTLMVIIEIISPVYVQIYQNIKKHKLNMALVLKNNRIYGLDAEGGLFHEHPAEDPTSHKPIKERLNIEAFVVRCLNILKDKGVL